MQRVGRSGGAGAQRVQEEWCSVRKMAELHSPARPVLLTCNNPARCSVWRRRMSRDMNRLNLVKNINFGLKQKNFFLDILKNCI